MKYFYDYLLLVLLITAFPYLTWGAKAQSDVSVLEKHGDLLKRPIVVVSTLDGKVTALDKQNGNFLWSFDAEFGPLLSSSLMKLPISQNGEAFWLIPSLKGRLFKFDGNSIESLPVTADELLSSSFKVSDGSILVGDNEVTTFAVNSSNGRLVYYCTADGCDTLEKIEPNCDVIILKRFQKTVRSVGERTGDEKWNFSVGEFKLHVSAGVTHDLISKNKEYQASDKFDKVKSEYDNSFGTYDKEHDLDDTEDLAQDFPSNRPDRFKRHGRTKMQVSVPDGLISQMIGQKQNWSYKFNSPIASVWHVDGHVYEKLDLFDPTTVPALKERGQSPNNNPAVYIGLYQESAYVQVSKTIERAAASNTAVSQFTKYSPTIKFTFRPFLGKADHLTDAVTDTPKPGDLSVYGSGAKNCKNNWISYMETSSNKATDVGFYLKSNSPFLGLTDQSERKGKVTEIIDMVDEIISESSTIEIIYIHGMSWWRQLVFLSILSVILAMLMHHGCHKFTKHEEQPPELPIMASPPQVKPETTDQKSDTNYDSRFLHDFEPIRRLGKGGFGIVLESRNKVDDCSYAVKRILLPQSESARNKMLREVRALAKLSHQGIVRYYNAWIEEPPVGWQESMDKEMLSKTNFTSNNFSKSQATVEYSESKSRLVKSTKGQFTKTRSFQHRNVAFEPTEPFVLPSNVGASGDLGFSFSDYPEQQGVKSSTSDEDTSFNASIPFQRYNANQSTDISIVFENSTKAAQSSSHDSAIVEDVIHKSSRRSPSRRKSKSGLKCKTSKSEIHESRISIPSTPSLENFYLYIQMELCQKESLQVWLATNKQRDNPYCLKIMKQVLGAVNYIHDQNLIHRDLKPSNIFFSHDGVVKVGDFGLVTESDELSMDTECEQKDCSLTDDYLEWHTEKVGTRLYMAPEQLSSRNYSQKVDIFATGLILIELFSIFSTQMERVQVLKHAGNGKLSGKFSSIFPEVSNLAKKMLSKEPQSRPSAMEAMQDEIFAPR